MAKQVRAKFTVVGYETKLHNRYSRLTVDGQVDYDHPDVVEMRSIVLEPVAGIGGSPENRDFWSVTPSGRIKLDMINPEAWSVFELGSAYYVDFTEAE